MLVSTTLTGNNESILGDALRSVVDGVDKVLVVDTGVTDKSLDVARDVAGDKLIVRSFPWRNDFSAARNFCLDAAAELGAAWAVAVDTDERLAVDFEALRALLATTDADAVLVDAADGTYAKERVFRIPTRVRWTGPTHEAFGGGDARYARLPGATFSELPKSPEALRAKFERDVAILRPYTAAHPTDPRWLFYLGDSYRNLGRLDEAAAAYEACAALRGWDEESAWACYRAAEIRCSQQDYVRALDRCVEGLARHPGVAELAWLAGFIAYRLGRPRHAVHWARLALVHGAYRGHAEETRRIAFRHRPALYAAPYDVLRFALRDLGDTEGASQAEIDFLQARAARLRK